jgi:uncharacterized membrane protein
MRCYFAPKYTVLSTMALFYRIRRIYIYIYEVGLLSLDSISGRLYQKCEDQSHVPGANIFSIIYFRNEHAKIFDCLFVSAVVSKFEKSP